MVRVVNKNLMITLVEIHDHMWRYDKSTGQTSLQHSTDLGFMAVWPNSILSSVKTKENTLGIYKNAPKAPTFLLSNNPSHEHLTLKVEHTTLLYIIYSSHILILHVKCAHSRPVHIIVYIIYCVFAILYIAYFYIILLSSVSCPVAVILLHCEASVPITNSSYV